ncbi:MAG: putative toxin-antitoxin system toxin component, PIN family [Chloroflexi bacterium]|nr:putative toxin-antitoxin system toxin component, PIN family [Chloroflexota bacterium]
MAKRKERILIVLDTNVFVIGFRNKYPQSAISRIWRLWLRRDLQLAISPEIAQEYEEILDRLGVDPGLLNEFIRELPTRETVTWIYLGRRIKIERDPDDEIILSTADSAQAKYLVTLDKDLLELPWAERRRFKFEIVTPAQFLERIT